MMNPSSKRKSIGISALAGFFVLFLVGSCNKQTSTEAQKETGTDKILVGSILALTGPAASYGEMMQRGLQLAESEINASGGIGGKQLSVIIEDSQFSAPKAVSAFQKLTSVQNVKAIVGITGSKIALPVAEAAKSGNYLIIDALSTAPALTERGGPRYFRVIASDALAGKYNTDWAIEEGMKKPALIYVEDEWGASYRNALQTYLKSKGFPDPLIEGVAAGSRDFRTQLQKIKDSVCDVVFLLTYSNEGAPFVQQLREAGVTSRVYGSDNLSSPEFTAVGATVIEGVRVALPLPTEGTEYDEFVKRFKTEFGMDPDVNALKSYDALNVAAKGMKEVGTDPNKIADYLHSPQFSYRGISGEIRFDQNGDLVSQQYRRQVYQNGSLVPWKMSKE
ncbi:MAG TPA: ABC transporter substrate-binding protein [Chthoniobacterales bacterium]|nr:ABC transporter substrate-binding protein [Chthoniobacterales bacterium]